MQILNQKVNHL